MMQAGLRVDVDTFRGTRYGVPRLLAVLQRHATRASFFFSVGPDNMGRNIWRLFRPAFFLKMLRTRAGSTYGWDIIFRGTFWPGPVIGSHLPDVIRLAAATGHEIGLHAWDHQAWQTRLDALTPEKIATQIQRGFDMLSGILGRKPDCSATPAWMTNDEALIAKESFPFRYNSDCRGESIFRPQAGDRELLQPQVPATLPTYDELIGRNSITNANYNEYMLSLIKPDRLNVLTIHAEVEGNTCTEMFDSFLSVAETKGIQFVALGSLLPMAGPLPRCAIERGSVPGRDGWVAKQSAVC